MPKCSAQPAAQCRMSEACRLFPVSSPSQQDKQGKQGKTDAESKQRKWRNFVIKQWEIHAIFRNSDLSHFLAWLMQNGAEIRSWRLRNRAPEPPKSCPEAPRSTPEAVKSVHT